jgi:hypothetical protein
MATRRARRRGPVSRSRTSGDGGIVTGLDRVRSPVLAGHFGRRTGRARGRAAGRRRGRSLQEQPGAGGGHDPRQVGGAHPGQDHAAPGRRHRHRPSRIGELDPVQPVPGHRHPAAPPPRRQRPGGGRRPGEPHHQQGEDGHREQRTPPAARGGQRDAAHEQQDRHDDRRAGQVNTHGAGGHADMVPPAATGGSVITQARSGRRQRDGQRIDSQEA